MPVAPLGARRRRDVRRGDACSWSGPAAVRPGFGIFDEATADAVIEICETLDGLPLGIELAAARMAAMSAIEVRDRLGDRFRLLTGPEHGPDRQLDPPARRGVVLRPAGRRRARGPATRRRCSPAASTSPRSAPSPGRTTTSRPCGCSTRWCASPWSSPTTASRTTRYSLYETIRTFADDQLAETRAGHAARSARRALRRPRPARAGSGGTGPAGATRSTGSGTSWPTCGPRSGGAASVATWSVATDVAAHAALMGFSVELFETIGWAEALLDEATRADVRAAPSPVRRGGLRLLRRAGRGRDRPRPSRHRARGAIRATSPASPATRRSSRPSAQVYCGNLDRYVELTREVAALPGTHPGVRDRRLRRRAAVVGPGRRGARADRRRRSTAARELGNPYWVAYTLVDRRVGAVEGRPAARAGDLGRGRGLHR